MADIERDSVLHLSKGDIEGWEMHCVTKQFVKDMEYQLDRTRSEMEIATEERISLKDGRILHSYKHYQGRIFAIKELLGYSKNLMADLDSDIADKHNEKEEGGKDA